MHHHLEHVQNVMQEHILVETKLYMVLLIVVVDVLQELIVPQVLAHVQIAQLDIIVLLEVRVQLKINVRQEPIVVLEHHHVLNVLQELIVPQVLAHVHNVELIHLVPQVLYHVQVVLQDITALQVLQVVQNVLLENHVQMVSLLIVVLVNIV